MAEGAGVREPASDEQTAGPVLAAVDVGSTSVHLLVAGMDPQGEEPASLLDESAFLGLGDRVAADGLLGRAARSELVETLAAFHREAVDLGASALTVVATEPLRRAADAATLVREAHASAGLAVHVLDHREEALLTLLGVTLGRPSPGGAFVVDIGGGSTELVALDGEGAMRTTGLPLGAARLTRELVRSDPPAPAEVDALRAEVRRLLAAAPALPGSPAPRPGQGGRTGNGGAEAVAVGGTASNLRKLLADGGPGPLLGRSDLAEALRRLSSASADVLAMRHGIRPARVRLLPAGALILDALLERFGAPSVRVSEAGIREGTVLAVARAGAGWRDRLPAVAAGRARLGPPEELPTR